MKLLLLILLVVGCIICASKSEKCAPTTQEDCENMTSEYEKYRACMERRTKRSADCYDEDETNCDKCDCNSCSYNSCDNCDNNNNCCEKCCQRSSCTTSNCCHQTCRAECRSNSCRTACRKRCQDRPANIEGPPSVQTQSKTASQHNITTVIHLNNVINNTNLINLPINVNNTVVNNITGQVQYGGGYTASQTSEEKCCLIIGPRQCVPQNTFPFIRCFHIRRKTCGNICSAPVIHYQTHEICDNDVGANLQQPCHQQTVYVPQPQPRCAYQQAWPYVSCGNQAMQTCDGCYSHYVKREDVTKCSNFCYDDGYGVGPYYRQAPFYRPGFAHAPSCYQTGMCGFDGYGYGYGYEGIPDNGFPMAYPPQPYPFVIEDCENCTFPAAGWDSPNSNEPFHQLEYKNLPPYFPWSNGSDKLMKIDASVNAARSERYAEIRIKPANESQVTTTTVSSEQTTLS